MRATVATTARVVHLPVTTARRGGDGAPIPVVLEEAKVLSSRLGAAMVEAEGWQRLQQAIQEALETAKQAGWLRGSRRKALEATLARLDEKLGSESTDLQLHVESVPDQCLLVVHSSDPVALDIVASFMHRAGSRKLGSAKVWLLPLGGVPANRWVRALRRVLTAERRHLGEAPGTALPVRLSVVWAHEDELVLADIG